MKIALERKKMWKSKDEFAFLSVSFFLELFCSLTLRSGIPGKNAKVGCLTLTLEKGMKKGSVGFNFKRIK
jgi:hypothetical protein